MTELHRVCPTWAKLLSLLQRPSAADASPRITAPTVSRCNTRSCSWCGPPPRCRRAAGRCSRPVLWRARRAACRCWPAAQPGRRCRWPAELAAGGPGHLRGINTPAWADTDRASCADTQNIHPRTRAVDDGTHTLSMSQQHGFPGWCVATAHRVPTSHRSSHSRRHSPVRAAATNPTACPAWLPDATLDATRSLNSGVMPTSAILAASRAS